MDYDKIFGVETSGAGPASDPGSSGPQGEDPAAAASEGGAAAPTVQQDTPATTPAEGPEITTTAENAGQTAETGPKASEDKAAPDPEMREQIAREVRARAAKQLDESIAALNNGLAAFEHNVIFSSHDHQLTQTVANRIIEINADGSITDRMCTYDEYMHIAEHEQAAE